MLKLTKKADYGLMAMKHLAEHAHNGACSAKDVAESYGIPPEVLAKILQRLTKAGLLHSQHGINDFIICCGYKGYMIKEYFANYFLHMSDVTFDMQGNRMEVHESVAEPWRVTLIDTGDNTGTGGRLAGRQTFG